MNEILAWIVLFLAAIFLLFPALGYEPEAYKNRYFDCMKRGFYFSCLMIFMAAIFTLIVMAVKTINT